MNLYQQSVRITARDNTRLNIDKGYRIEIKIPDPATHPTWTFVLEGRDSTDHVTATDR